MMPKNVGIVTLQKSPVNYGAALQCYALWKYVNSLGYSCEVLDILRPCHKGYKYSPEFGEKGPSVLQILKSKTKKILGYNKEFMNRKKLFEEFHKQLGYSCEYNSVRALSKNPPAYDIFLTGSDQVWNPYQPIYNGSYFWEFRKGNGKVISYASSFSVEEIPENQKEKYIQWLKVYESLSVREEAGQKIIRSLLGRDSTLVLDPVFLLSKEEWKELKHHVAGIPDHYCFIYLVKYDSVLVEKAKQFAIRKKLPLYMVLSQSLIVYEEGLLQLVDVGPKEWLYLIDHSDYFLTDSFHGTSFAIILQKPFVTFVNSANQTNSRIHTILDSLGLTSHINYKESNDIILEQQFNYNKETTTTSLTELITASKNYLKEALR